MVRASERMRSALVPVLALLLGLVAFVLPWWTIDVRGPEEHQAYDQRPFVAENPPDSEMRLEEEVQLTGILWSCTLAALLALALIAWWWDRGWLRHIAAVLVLGIGAFAVLYPVDAFPPDDAEFWDERAALFFLVKTYANVGWYLAAIAVAIEPLRLVLRALRPREARRPARAWRT